jgi:cellulose/xylan binding protein with CBM9 domain
MTRSMRACAMVVVVLCCAVPHVVRAGSGFVAYIPPLEPITVDGSLDDWPADVPAWQLDAVFKRGGYDPEDPEPDDLTARFRAAWNADTQRVYVAVIVRDDRLSLGTGVTNTDVCELYVDGDGSSGPAAPQQFLMFPGDASYDIFGGSQNPTLSDGDANASGVLGAWSVSGDTIVYEWALPPLLDRRGDRELLRPGLRIGFDAVAVDKDTDARGSTWLSWSPGGSKVANPDRIGELVLLPSLDAVTGMARIHGTVVQPGSQESWRGVVVRAQRSDQTVASAVSGARGVFTMLVPPGSRAPGGTGR